MVAGLGAVGYLLFPDDLAFLTRLIALLWASVFVTLVLAFSAMRGFAPMPFWGSAEVTLKFTGDGKSVIAVTAQTAANAAFNAGETVHVSWDPTDELRFPS